MLNSSGYKLVTLFCGFQRTLSSMQMCVLNSILASYQYNISHLIYQIRCYCITIRKRRLNSQGVARFYPIEVLYRIVRGVCGLHQIRRLRVRDGLIADGGNVLHRGENSYFQHNSSIYLHRSTPNRYIVVPIRAGVYQAVCVRAKSTLGLHR